MGNTSVKFGFGHALITLQIPQENLLGVIIPAAEKKPRAEKKIVARAMAQPIGSPRLRKLVRPGEEVAIATSDLTRPCPSDRLLPPILAELEAAGIPDKDIYIILGLGLHRPMTNAEVEQAVGTKIARRYRVLNHDVNDVVRLGVTSAGTPVEFFRPLVEADCRIGLGVLEFHYFAGFSGGAKAFFPGCASRAAVTANHAMLVHPAAAPTRLEDNPVRLDIEEAVGMLGADFILNVIVDGEHRVVEAFAGNVTAAHRAGCAAVSTRGQVKIPKLADIVIAGTGGFPKDINLYQAQKALDNAAYFARPGGVVILVAECPEGLGNQTFEKWMHTPGGPAAILERIQREFMLGGHKAAAIANVQQKVQIYLVSKMAPELVRQFGILPFDSPQAALQAAITALEAGSASPQVLALPLAASILPEMLTAQAA